MFNQRPKRRLFLSPILFMFALVMTTAGSDASFAAEPTAASVSSFHRSPLHPILGDLDFMIDLLKQPGAYEGDSYKHAIGLVGDQCLCACEICDCIDCNCSIAVKPKRKRFVFVSDQQYDGRSPPPKKLPPVDEHYKVALAPAAPPPVAPRAAAAACVGNSCRSCQPMSRSQSAAPRKRAWRLRIFSN